MRRLTRLAFGGGLLAAVLAAAPGATAGVSVGHSGWEWGNPTPQGNTLRAVEFIGARGYAAGDFGTVLRTDDAGATWRGVATGVTVPLARLRMIGPDSLVTGGGCSLRRSDDGGDSFRRLPWTPRDSRCPAEIASLAFPSADVGYLLLADGSVRRSTDGGARWAARTALPNTRATRGEQGPRDILFTSADTGYAVTGGTGAGAILRTTDGGGSWTPVQAAPEPINGLWFVDANVGYAVGNGGTVFRTEDAGATWALVPVTAGTAPLDLQSIRCADARTCIATKERGDEVFRTADGGATWVPVSPSTEPVVAAAFASATRAVAVGAGGVTVLSDDAGATWVAIGARIGDSSAFRALSATSNTVAYAFGGAGLIARTIDAGESWGSIAAPTTEDLRSVSFANVNVGYALDAEGTLFRTDDGGASWSILDTGTSTAPRGVVALDETTVLLVGPTGLRRSTDGGASFSRVTDRVVSRAKVSRVDVAAGAIFVYGSKSLAFSINGGRSWRSLKRPTRGSVAQYDWISRRFGYALDAGGRLYQTRTGGKRWSEITSMGALDGESIAFSSLNEGYVRLSEFGDDDVNGYVLRTLDAGRTWRPQLVSEGSLLDVVAAGSTDYALAAHGGLFAARGGGSQGAESTLTLAPKRSRRSSKPRRKRRSANVQITGRLRPAEGGEEIVVTARRGNRVSVQVVTAATNGSFTTTWRISGPTTFVAQWRGDDDRRGDGSRTLVVAPR